MMKVGRLYMVGKEAWNSLMEGKKVRYVLWPENEYIYFDKSEYKIKNSYGIETIFYVSDIEEDAWELYRKNERRNAMNTVEAFNVLMSGKKVRNTEWVKNAYIYYDEKSLTIKDNNNNSQSSIYFDEYFSNNQWELYEEPKKVIKVFISQPMSGRTKCKITEERNKVKKLIEAKYGEAYQIEYLNEDSSERPKDWTRIQNLGYSIMNMHDADVVVFAPLWGGANGCLVEHSVARLYEKNMLYCSIDFDTLDE